MINQLEYCAWMYPLFFFLIARKRDKSDEILVHIIASAIAALLVAFVVFCTIHAVGLAWGRP